MPKSLDDLQKHTLHLFAGDYARIQALFPKEGAALIIRNMVHAYLKKYDPPVDAKKIKGEVDV